MARIRRGAFAGLLAGLLLTGLLFVDDVPGKQLVFVAEWFGLSSRGGSAWEGALLLLVLGGLVGGLFGATLRHSLPIGWSLLLGLGVGVLWWLVVVLFLARVVQRLEFSEYTMLLYVALSLLFGMMLGSIYAKLEHGHQ